MPIRVRCPECEAAYNIADEKRGKSIRCSKCQTVFKAEAPDDDEDTGVTASPKSAAPKKA